MATTLSRYLRLKLDSNLTANAKYNLDRIDALGATFIQDSTNRLNIRSESDIQLEPESPDLDGSGEGGTITLGTSDHEVDLVAVYAAIVNFSNSVGLLDSGTAGTRYLRLKYKSDLTGSTDTTADRTLSIDMAGADRQLQLGGNVQLAGDLTTSGGDLSVTVASDLALSFPVNTAGYLQNDGSGVLTWVSLSGAGDVLGETATWASGDGTTKVVTHSLASSNLEIQIYDEQDSLIWIDSITIDSTSQVTLVSSEAPTVSWRVVLHAKP